MKHPDIYVGQANTSGYLDTLQRSEHNGFVYYQRKRVWVYPAERGPISLHTARRLRREWIGDRKTQGLTVKGVRWVSLELIEQLNRSRFIIDLPGTQLRNYEDVALHFHQNKRFILIAHFHLGGQGIVFGPEFGNLSLGLISSAIKEGRVFTAVPREHAEEI